MSTEVEFNSENTYEVESDSLNYFLDLVEIALVSEEEGEKDYYIRNLIEYYYTKLISKVRVNYYKGLVEEVLDRVAKLDLYNYISEFGIEKFRELFRLCIIGELNESFKDLAIKFLSPFDLAKGDLEELRTRAILFITMGISSGLSIE
jgi:hypothetical protein